jgi:hypothetical protein
MLPLCTAFRDDKCSYSYFDATAEDIEKAVNDINDKKGA